MYKCYSEFFLLFYLKSFRFISLYYTDGDVCDLTKTRRIVEVKLRYMIEGRNSTKTIKYSYL